MTETEKVIVGVGAGLLIGKAGGSLAWWLLGAGTAFFIIKSPTVQRTVKSGFTYLKAKGAKA